MEGEEEMSITKCPTLFPKIPKESSLEQCKEIQHKNKEEWAGFSKGKEVQEINELLWKLSQFYKLSKELGLECFINLTDKESKLIKKDNQFINHNQCEQINLINGQIGIYLNLRILNIK